MNSWFFGSRAGSLHQPIGAAARVADCLLECSDTAPLGHVGRRAENIIADHRQQVGPEAISAGALSMVIPPMAAYRQAQFVMRPSQ